MRADNEDASLIVGAENIAVALSITRAQFYKARHKGGLKFVWQEPGPALPQQRLQRRNISRTVHVAEA
jgi:hypothetical protein